MAASFDAVSSSATINTVPATSKSHSHTCTGTDRVLYAWLTNSSSIASASVTYNGVSMTQVGNYSSNGAGLYILIAPATGANTLSASGMASGDITLHGLSFAGADQTTGHSGLASTFIGSGTPSQSVTSTADGVVAWFDVSGGPISSPTQTTRSIENINSNSGVGNGATQTAAGTGSSISGGWADNSDQHSTVGLNVLSNTPPGPGTPGGVYVKEVGFVTNTTSAGTSAITVATGGVPAGDVIVIYGACDNTGTSGAATTIAVADNSSQSGTANTYSLQTSQAIADPGAASAGQQGFFVVCVVTRPLLASDTITITYGNSTAAKAINAQQFSGIRRDVPVLSGSYATQNNQTGQSVTVAAGADPTRAGQVVCALVAVEGGTADAFTQDTDTTNGTWVALTRRGSGTTTSGSTLNSVYKIVTAAGAQTYNHATMLGTSRDHCAAILVLDTAPASDRRPRRRRFFPVPHARRAGR